MSKTPIEKTIEAIDAILPQTQCGLCEYTGCKPYATAIAKQTAPIDKCLPGGVPILKKLAELTAQSVDPYLEGMQQKAKPDCVAVIDEALCIGCTKCIQACPVDAIIGGAKVMTTIISDACNGCELCVEPCPMDCIDIINLPERNQQQRQLLADQSRQRFYQHEARVNHQEQHAKQQHQQAKESITTQSLHDRKAAIAAAIARAKHKKH